MINFQAQSRLAVLVLAAIALIALTVKGYQPQKPAGPPEKITLAYSTATNAIFVYIAFAQGYFTEEGLDATSQPHTFGKVALHHLPFLVFHNPRPLLITP